MININDGDLGKPLSRVVMEAPLSLQGHHGQGHSAEPVPSPPGREGRRGPGPTMGTVAWPGQWHFGSEKPAPRVGARGAIWVCP